jgi:hypothetical protein
MSVVGIPYFGTDIITNNQNFELTQPYWAALFSDNNPLRDIFI